MNAGLAVIISFSVEPCWDKTSSESTGELSSLIHFPSLLQRPLIYFHWSSFLSEWGNRAEGKNVGSRVKVRFSPSLQANMCCLHGHRETDGSSSGALACHLKKCVTLPPGTDLITEREDSITVTPHPLQLFLHSHC